MEVPKEMRLRLRFYKDIPQNIAVVRQKFEDFKVRCPKDYSIKVNENHIWLHIVGDTKQYYSPHLHVELEQKEGNHTHLRCLFGPDPTLWTLFMFLHFIVGGIFLLFGMIAYSNFTMNQPILMDGIIMSLMVLVWLLLYIVAKQIRERGNDQMHDLEVLLEQIMH